MFDPLDYRLSELNTLQPAKGRILISDPFLPDPYFKRSVVLLVEHSEEGSLGFILNKALEISINDTELNMDIDHQMYFGGPVQSSDLFYIHSKGEAIPESQEVKDGLFWGGNFKELESMLKEGRINQDEIRMFIGYSGWEAEQLEKEIEEDSWLVLDFDLNQLLSQNSEHLWKNLLSDLDDSISILSTFPEDPNMN